VDDGGLFSGGMAADSRVSMQVLLKEHARVFGEVRSSLVDVGGSHGATAAAVARAFPHVKCTVLDLADVVAGAPTNDSVTFVAGDMFEYIPPADAVLLKVTAPCASEIL
jgi:trans-aconitate methyltransferase